MPSISTGKVLVSGANGYIAFWLVRQLLEKGYAVRGSVRSAEKGKFLNESFKAYGDKFEIAVVEDITKDGAFDEAVKGVDAIAHTASPFYLSAASVDELVTPAVNGTVSILKSAIKNGNNVKRVVLLSSCASVLTIGSDKVFNEDDWNELACKEIREQGDKALGITKYRASKTLAEKAAWEFVEKYKPTWDLAALNPPFVFGPFIHDAQSVDSLNTSARQWHDVVLKDEGKPRDFYATQGSAWIDVRDVAYAHVVALEKEAAGGERVIISAGSFVWQDWLDVANALSPNPIPSHSQRPAGYPGAGHGAKPPVAYNTAKEARILGLKYRTMEETARDTLADFEARGW